jgi:hypothetical protein
MRTLLIALLVVSQADACPPKHGHARAVYAWARARPVTVGRVAPAPVAKPFVSVAPAVGQAAKTCPCSPACTCGCNDGKACSCGGPMASTVDTSLPTVVSRQQVCSGGRCRIETTWSDGTVTYGR